MDFVRNADETGLSALPSKSLVSRREAATPGFKMSKDPYTVMVCANGTGTHKFPLFLIEYSINVQKPNKFMPIYSWNDLNTYVFVPEVIQFQENIGKEGKVLECVGQC